MSTAPHGRPDPLEFPPFYAAYVALVTEDDVVTALRNAGAEMTAALSKVTEARGNYAYAEGKWSIKTVIGHVIDGERIFQTRALRVARADTTPLPGFDENAFAAISESNTRTMADLTGEWTALRDCSVRMYDTFPRAAWRRIGTVNKGHISVRALAFVTCGHARHHLNMLRQRYDVR